MFKYDMPFYLVLEVFNNILSGNMPYVESAAPDQRVYPHSLILQLHIPLICKIR